MSSAHPRVPVRLQTWEESLRRCAEPINYLLDRQATTGIMFGLSLVALSIPATSPGTVIAPYTGEVSSEYIDADITTGQFTCQEAGLYTIGGDIIITNGAQNVDYLLEIDINGVQSVISTAFWAAPQQTTITLAGDTIRPLAIGDVISLRLFASSAGTVDIPQGNFTVRQL